MYRIKTIIPKPTSKYYNWTKADSYNCPIRGAIGKRGIGKTFGPFKASILDACKYGYGFIYVVENKEQIKTLAQDRGAKFFEAIKQYALDNPNTHKGILYKKLIEGETEVEGEDLDNVFNTSTEIKGGTIRLNKKNIGYIMAWDDFANIKRNNFPLSIKRILIDEFMPEVIDKNSIQIARKITSLIQSIARTREDIIIYLMSNALRRTDSLLDKLKVSNIKLGEAKIVYDDYGPLLYIEYINPDLYNELNKIQDKSVASRFARLVNEDNLDRNIFRDELKDNEIIPSEPKACSLICCLHTESGSVRISITKDHKDVYVFEDYGENTKKRYCIDKRFIAPSVLYVPEYKDYITLLYNKGICRFASANIKAIFKEALNIKA